MALSTKTIKTRIRSVQNTKKITKAMELVSAAKMRRTVGAVVAARPYSTEIWTLTQSLLSAKAAAAHPLLAKRETVKRACIILISTNRGLCGGFAINVLNTALQAERELRASEKTAPEIDWIVLGKKGAAALAHAGKSIVAEFEKPDITTDTGAITPIASLIREKFVSGEYDSVSIAYTDYASALTQKPRVRQLLPLLPPDAELGTVNRTANGPAPSVVDADVLFEPSRSEILTQLLPHVIEMQLYQALLESNASEHSARMMAMRNATDAAGEMIDELVLVFNQARQAGITREIAEIAGGKAALE